MGSSRLYIARSLMVLMIGVTLTTRSSGQLLDQSDLISSAEKVSTAMIPAPFPRAEFAPVTATFYPAVYRPSASSELRLLPAIGLQWWVSPNLAVLGGLGSGLTEQQVVQLLRIGFKYLPGSFALGPFTPEMTFTRNRVEDLPEYELKWNEVSWAYDAKIGPVNVAGALVLIYHSIFPRSEAKAAGVPGKLEASTRCIILSAGYGVYRWLKLSVQAKVNPDFITGGVQLSLAI